MEESLNRSSCVLVIPLFFSSQEKKTISPCQVAAFLYVSLKTKVSCLFNFEYVLLL